MKIPGKNIYIYTSVDVDRVIEINLRPGEELHFKRDFLRYVYKKDGRKIALNVSYIMCGDIEGALECLRKFADELLEAMVEGRIKEIVQRKNSYKTAYAKTENGKTLEIEYRKYEKTWEIHDEEWNYESYKGIGFIEMITRLKTFTVEGE